MINKAFDIVNKKVSEVLSSQGFKKQSVKSGNNDEMVMLYTNESIAYSVVYYKSKKYMVLRSCSVFDGEPDNEWKTLSTWMFNPDVDTENEASSIGNDFAQMLSPTQVNKNTKTARKRKSNDDGNGDPIFFSKRLVAVIPELKDEIKYEERNYSPFRCVTFTRQKIVPRINSILKQGNKKDIDKLAEILSNQYNYGNLDVRSCITVVILNSIESEESEKILWDRLSPNLQKAWKAAKRFKGKKVKPEKVKAKRSYMADTLQK